LNQRRGGGARAHSQSIRFWKSRNDWKRGRGTAAAAAPVWRSAGGWCGLSRQAPPCAQTADRALNVCSTGQVGHRGKPTSPLAQIAASAYGWTSSNVRSPPADNRLAPLPASAPASKTTTNRRTAVLQAAEDARQATPGNRRQGAWKPRRKIWKIENGKVVVRGGIRSGYHAGRPRPEGQPLHVEVPARCWRGQSLASPTGAGGFSPRRWRAHRCDQEPRRGPRCLFRSSCRTPEKPQPLGGQGQMQGGPCRVLGHGADRRGLFTTKGAGS